MNKKQASKPEDEALSGLIDRMEDFVRSARNALQLPPEHPDRGARVGQETARLRAMFHAWLGIENETELEARMHFTRGVEFFGGIQGQTRGETLHNAETLIARVTALSPRIGAQMKREDVANAVARKAATGRFDWDAMLRAWGRPVASLEAWRTDYVRRQKKRRP